MYGLPRSFRLAAIIVLLILLSSNSSADTFMLKDINLNYPVESQNPNQRTDDSNPGGFIVLSESLVVFLADDGASQKGVWRTDGTADGTTLVKAIDVSSFFVKMGSIVMFAANDGTNGVELWRTDGTTAGTYLVKDINPGSESSVERSLAVAITDTLIFTASDGNSAGALWRSDGTSEGTFPLTDVTSRPAAPFNLFAVEEMNQVFLTADDGTNSRAIWKTDGTLAGTARVANICSDGSCINPMIPLAHLNGNFYFHSSNSSATNPNQLWRTDGTEAGTVLVKDMYVGSYTTGGHDPMPISLASAAVVGQYLYFPGMESFPHGTYGIELWRTDGTEAGTTRVTDLSPGSLSSVVRDIGNFNGGLYFTATDRVSGLELWISDGTALNTFLLRDIGEDRGHGINSLRAAEVFGKLFFTANDQIVGTELWVSNGTWQGTELVADIFPGAEGSRISELVPFGNGIIFAADNGVHGRELWVNGFTQDLCPNDPNKDAPGACGCGVPDDVNQDGTPDCQSKDNIITCSDLSSDYIPEKPKLTTNGRRLVVSMQQCGDVTYKVRIKVFVNGRRKGVSERRSRRRLYYQRKKVRSSQHTTRSFPPGSSFIVNYQIRFSDKSLQEQTRFSRSAKIRLGGRKRSR